MLLQKLCFRGLKTETGRASGFSLICVGLSGRRPTETLRSTVNVSLGLFVVKWSLQEAEEAHNQGQNGEEKLENDFKT